MNFSSLSVAKAIIGALKGGDEWIVALDGTQEENSHIIANVVRADKRKLTARAAVRLMEQDLADTVCANPKVKWENLGVQAPPTAEDHYMLKATPMHFFFAEGCTPAILKRFFPKLCTEPAAWLRSRELPEMNGMLPRHIPVYAYGFGIDRAPHSRRYFEPTIKRLKEWIAGVRKWEGMHPNVMDSLAGIMETVGTTVHAEGLLDKRPDLWQYQSAQGISSRYIEMSCEKERAKFPDNALCQIPWNRWSTMIQHGKCEINKEHLERYVSPLMDKHYANCVAESKDPDKPYGLNWPDTEKWCHTLPLLHLAMSKPYNLLAHKTVEKVINERRRRYLNDPIVQAWCFAHNHLLNKD